MRSLSIVCQLALLLSLAIYSVSLQGQQCQAIQNFDGSPVGPLPQAPGNAPGLYGAFGEPIIVEENCTPGGSRSLRLRAGDVNGGPPDGVVYTMTGGFGGGEPFLPTKQYQMSFSKAVSAASIGTNGMDYLNTTMTIALTNTLSTCSGTCEVLMSKDISDLTTSCESWDVGTFSPMQDWDYIMIYIETVDASGNNNLFITIDDLCIEEVQSCTASFVLENSGCGDIFITDNNQGATGLQYRITEPGLPTYTLPSPLPFPISFVTNGNHTISLEGFCNGVLTVFQTETFTVTGLGLPIYQACPPATIKISASSISPCIVDFVLPDLQPFDPDNDIIAEVCTVDGTVVTGSNIALGAGLHTVSCNLEDACGNNTVCQYQVDVTCLTFGPCINPGDYTVGPLVPFSPGGGSGLYSGTGQAVITTEYCLGSSEGLGLQLTAGTPSIQGDVVLVRPTAIDGGDPIFRAGQQYEYSFGKMVSSSTVGDVETDYSNTRMVVALTNDLDCNQPGCLTLASKSLTSEITNGDCGPWDRRTFTPAEDYQAMAIYAETTPLGNVDELNMVINELCVNPVFACSDGNDLQLGDLFDPPTMSMKGTFRAYGQPELVVGDDCTNDMSMKSIRVKASTPNAQGDAIVVIPGGDDDEEPIYKMGRTYEYSFNKVLSSINTGDIEMDFENTTLSVWLTDELAPCNMGNCQLVQSKIETQALASGDCSGWFAMTFEPNRDYRYLIIELTTTPTGTNDDLYVNLDDICVSQVASMNCEATFDYFNIVCDSIKFYSTSVDAVSWQFEFFGPGTISPVANDTACIRFPAAGTYQVQLSITCADGTFDRSVIETITIEPIDTIAPVLADCPMDQEIFGTEAPDCSTWYTPVFDVTDNSGPFSYDVRVNGTFVPDGDSIFLNAGVHQVVAIFSDACGNSTICEYEITVGCRPLTACTDFDNQDQGGWYRYNKILRDPTNPSLGYNISTRSVALPTPGPSGLPSDVFMQADDYSGSTWLVNEADYDGSWKTYIGNCFCFDFDIIDDGDSGGIPRDAAPYFILSSSFDKSQPIHFGTNPVHAIRWRSTITKTERDGWNQFCIEVDSCDASGSLPIIDDGVWEYISGASSTCTDFNDVLCNVETVMFGLDLTGSPTEQYGFDNICTGPCPPEPQPCALTVSADTISQENGSCCYELDMSVNTSWYYVDYDLTTPGVLFNTAMVDTSAFDLDTLSNGTKLRVTGKTPGFGGNLPVSTMDFMKFCFANVDSSSQTPQCVVASAYGPGPVDNVVLICRDTLKFGCPAPTTEPDSCLILSLEAPCDPDDPFRYKLNVDVTNLTGNIAQRVNLTSQDPNVRFLPIGAPAGSLPQPTISLTIPGGLAPTATITGLMATVVTTSAISSPTQWCVEGHLLTDGMCCTAPDYFCTELDVCCDPCEEKSIEVTDISGIATGQTLSFGASDDGDWSLVQVGGGPDVSGPTLSVITFDNTLISDGLISQTYINFDFLDDLCDDAVITSARLKLFADTNTSGHSTSATDNNCILLQRVFAGWDETTMATTLPPVSGINVSFLDSPTSTYQNYDLDVTTLTQDIIANGGFGFAMIPQCSDKNMTFQFASKDHPNTALHPQLILTIDDSNCPDPTVTGECCHAVDLTNECPTDFFTSVELKSITPGVNIGSHSTGGTAPQDWYVSNSTPNCVTWNHTSGYIPSGTTADLMEFCLDDIDPTEVPQEVVLHWYANDGNGEPYTACSDTMRFECQPPVNDSCITVIDTEVKGSPCDSLDCYETPWCVQWLRDTISGQSSLPEILSYNTIEKGLWNSQVVFIATNPTPPGAANIGNTDIYLCNGTLIQKCEITLLGEVCNPNLSIDPFSDITGKMLVWQTGDVIPPLDPDCISNDGNANTVDVCLTFKNSSQHYADQFIIYPITSGVSYWPNPVSLLPGGSNPCDTSTVTFQLYGSASTPGTTVKFAVRLADTQNPDDWCCFESDTVCVTIPECPPVDDCCASQDTFDTLVNQGLQITENSCTVTVCANQFDTCHWFPNLSPDWGDGSIILPAVLQSDPPNNCWTYTYTTPGTYTITLPVWEGTIDDNCWSDILQYTFVCEEEVLPCDSLTVTNGPATNVDSTCCSTFTINNGDSGNTYKGVVIRTTPPVSISQVQGLNGYIVNQLTPYRAEVLQPSGSMPLDQQDIFTLCTAGYSPGPNLVTVHWLQQVGNDCVEVCPSELEMDCSMDDEFKCFEFVQDSVHCETSTYCFQIKNTSNPSFDIASVILYGVSGGTLSPTSVTIPGGPLAAGDTSNWICVNYSGAMPGDTICHRIAAENAVSGDASNICCTDTLVQCFVVPACPPNPQPLCGECPNGQPLGANLIVNGDFEAGNTGFASGHTYVPNGSLTAGEYSVRSSGSLANSSWSAVDYGTGTGSFLAVDGAINIPFYIYNGIATVPGQDYSLCLFYDHLVDPTALTDSGPPIIDVVIDGTVVASINVDQVPDGWQNFTYTHAATSATTDIQLVLSNSTSIYNDIAIDNISFASCGAIITDNCCDNIDEDEITDYYTNNLVVINGDCEGCITVDPLDTCDVLFVDFDGNGDVLIEGDTTCYAFTQAGTYPFTVKVERRDSDGELCYEELFDLQFDIVDCPPIDDCCDISQEDFDTKFATGINYNLTGCELCLPFALDSCEYLDVDYGDGTTISLQGGGLVPCYTYAGTSGSYTVSIDYYRLNGNGDTCQYADTVLQIITSCPPSSGSCLAVVDGELDCEQGVYCFRITNTSTFTMKSLAFIELTAGVALSPDPYLLQTPLVPGMTSEEICLTYIGGFQGDTVCFDVVGHQEDITIGEPPAFCCKDTLPVCFVIDCPVVPSSCLAVTEDSLDCVNDMYCIRVRNLSTFDMNSIAFHNYSAGHSLSPDPTSIPTLTPGSTSDWICLTIQGAVQGDEICYNIIGHEQDLSMGQEPIFCCSDTVRYCFTYDCDSDNCCAVTDMEVADLLQSGLDVEVDDCELMLPFLEDSCAMLTVDFGDGMEWQSSGTQIITHSYMNNGVYTVVITLEYFDDNGIACRDTSGTLEVEITDCGNGLVCNVDDLVVYNALSPNRDGRNDELVIEGTVTCERDIKVYNRWGQLVYKQSNYQNDWQGTSQTGGLLAEGTYFLIIELTDADGQVSESRQLYIEIRK